MEPSDSMFGAHGEQRLPSREQYEAAMHELAMLPQGRPVSEADVAVSKRVLESCGVNCPWMDGARPYDRASIHAATRRELENAIGDFNRVINGRAQLVTDATATIAKGYQIVLQTPLRSAGGGGAIVCSVGTPLSSALAAAKGQLGAQSGAAAVFRTPPEFHGLPTIDSSVLSPIHVMDITQ